MAPIIEEITEVGCFKLGEAPHWDNQTQSLYFVDILGKSVHKYVPSTKKHSKIVFDKSPSFIIPIQNSSDRFIISLNKDICIITWDGVSTSPSHIERIATVDTHPEGVQNILNDGKVDAFGTLWAGTLNGKADIENGVPKTGALYSITGQRIKKQVFNICASNGLAWSKDSKKFYFIDSGKKTIDQFDYDCKNLTLSNCQTLFSFRNHGISGFPDGQTLDDNGNLWVAGFKTQKVFNIGTNKPESLLGFINLPESLVTSVCFGGRNLDELYVTCAGIRALEKDIKKPVKGALYRITGLGVKGLPAQRFKL